ncbi:ACR3 family arsenite efflux pump ArsB [Bacillus sp. SLBN-46]|jgi:ACR3 family arsenite efflux pump ArsB|uniref:hypothetical protein n=1 Tax=Bacillus sp. SLBN-46 TaxID=3042283 RepID=UPI00285791BE|nr:hypothetical protein [Bacillus sp. SLBN-46]MDR6122549.1 ACR3 family arsenite efflux pump ArsB [Bacillus sp. SLBN-46]
MFFNVSMLLVTFLGGYLTIQWIPITHPFVLSDFFISLVVNPIKFFAASLAFFIGILCAGSQIRMILHTTKRTWKKDFHLKFLFYSKIVGLLVVLFILFQLGWEHSLVFFSLSMVYGIISVKQ